MPQKYEREIDEILRRMESVLPEEPSRRQPLWLVRQAVGRFHLPVLRLTPGKLMAAGLVLALLSYVLRPILPWPTAPLGLAALVLFIAALVLSVAQSRRRRPAGWRGRSLDYRDGNDLIWAGWLRRWREWRRARKRGQRF